MTNWPEGLTLRSIGVAATELNTQLDNTKSAVAKIRRISRFTNSCRQTSCALCSVASRLPIFRKNLREWINRNWRELGTIAARSTEQWDREHITPFKRMSATTASAWTT